MLLEAEKERGDQGRRCTPVLKPRVCPDSYCEPQYCIEGVASVVGQRYDALSYIESNPNTGD